MNITSKDNQTEAEIVEIIKEAKELNISTEFIEEVL